MTELIVNADDLGISARRNDGIFEAHHRGIVTAASILASGDGFDDAVARLKEAPELDVGLHFNLSEGRPCAEGHVTLVNRDGLFFGKELARRRALETRFDPMEVEREFEAQMRILDSAGVRVSHLDGHQHLHVFGDLPEAIARTASRRGVRYVRCPVDTLFPSEGLSQLRRAQVSDYRDHALAAEKVYSRYRMRSTELFGGIALSGLLSLDSLLAAVRGLPDTTVELMVHPGKADAPDGFSGPAREAELAALTHPSVKEEFTRLGIRLTTFRGLKG